tara:strand:+ start:3632 stop:3796 length:165 start_codon:yes stop_codon:yes gene_type:complete
MKDHQDIATTLGVNGTVLGVTWLSDLEIFLKLLLLVLSIVYTVIKIISHFRVKK